LGFSDEKLASAIGVSRSTLHDWRKSNPEFADTLKTAKATADSKVIDALFQRATGYQAPDGTHIPAHPTAIVFWLKNRQPSEWRDTARHEITAADGKPLAAPQLLTLQPDQEAALARVIADAQARVRLQLPTLS
jgi:transcriptional regulator with XRE-family HTH domain